jgi:hypothetical protein
VIAYNDSVGVRVLGNGDGNAILGTASTATTISASTSAPAASPRTTA